MATSYSTYFNFPLLEAGSDGWDATMNGMIVDLDKLLAEARSPLIWDDNTAGRIDGSEVLTYDGEVLLFA